jgi:hypothetical protein
MKDRNVAVIIGNGESRRHFNLSQLPTTVSTIGCNAICRDFFVDHLVCCDRRMVIESLNKYSGPIYTRRKHYLDFRKIKKKKSIFQLPEIPYVGSEKKDQGEHWNSGPYAVLLACEMDFKKIVLLGFDLFSNDGLINNLYKGTDNYQSPTSLSVDAANWIYQFKKLFQIYQDREFIIVNNSDWPMPISWHFSNVRKIDIEKLYNSLQFS